MKKLTPKQEKFCNLYIELGNASEAYRKAYDVREDTKPTSINEKASQLLSRVDIRSRVEEIRNEVKEAHKIDRSFIVKGLLEVISDADYTFKLGKNNTLSTEDSKAFYRLMNQTKNTDKLRALEQLAKMLGLNEPDRTETTIKTVEIIEKSRD